MTKQAERAEQIVNSLAEFGEISVDDLAKKFNVTGMTVRRDLSSLESQGVITRTHGGCVLRSPLTPYVHELPFSEKNRQNPLQKSLIAKMAVSCIPDNATVYLDTGTTATHIARHFHQKPCRVFTNNLCAAMELFGNKNVTVTVFGGNMASGSPDLCGEGTFERICNFHYDLAILGGDALDLDTGELFAADMDTAILSKAAQTRSKNTLIALDASKIGKTSLSVVRTIQEGDILVTDNNLKKSTTKKLTSMGIDLRIAKETGK